MLLEVLLGGSNELDGSELEAAVLETRDDGTDQATLNAIRLDSNEAKRNIPVSELFSSQVVLVQLLVVLSPPTI